MPRHIVGKGQMIWSNFLTISEKYKQKNSIRLSESAG